MNTNFEEIIKNASNLWDNSNYFNKVSQDTELDIEVQQFDIIENENDTIKRMMSFFEEE